MTVTVSVLCNHIMTVYLEQNLFMGFWQKECEAHSGSLDQNRFRQQISLSTVLDLKPGVVDAVGSR